jgi:hypothetical protein
MSCFSGCSGVQEAIHCVRSNLHAVLKLFLFLVGSSHSTPFSKKHILATTVDMAILPFHPRLVPLKVDLKLIVDPESVRPAEDIVDAAATETGKPSKPHLVS